MRPFAVSIAALVLAAVTPVWAQSPHDDTRTPEERWAWEQFRNDEIADFDKKCHAEPAPYGELAPYERTVWDDPCRRIRPQFLVNVLTVPKWPWDRLPRHRVRLRGARVDGTIDLSDAEITPAVRLDASRIEGDLILEDSHWDRLLSLSGSTLTGKFAARRMRSESDIWLDEHATIKGDVDLAYSKVGGKLWMNTSSFMKGVTAQAISVAGVVDMTNATFGGDVVLTAAKVGILQMNASSFTKGVDANAISVTGALLMREHAKFDGNVDLTLAKIGGTLEMGDSSFGGEVDLKGAKVVSIIELQKATATRINLSGATAQEAWFNGLQ